MAYFRDDDCVAKVNRQTSVSPMTRTKAELINAAHPRPWDWTWIGANASGGGHVYLTDANGRKIAAIWGKAEEKEATADLIISLVNNAEP